MKRKSLGLFFVFIVFLSSTGCGTIDKATRRTYASEPIETPAGIYMEVTTTGIFGSDATTGILKPKANKVDPVINLQTTTEYERHLESKKSKCGNPSQMKDFYWEDESRKTVVNRQVLNPAAQGQGKPIVVRNGNPSTGNAAVPALFGAAGQIGAAAVRQGDIVNIRQIGGGAKANAESSSDSNSSSSSSSGSEANVDTNVDVGIND